MYNSPVVILGNFLLYSLEEIVQLIVRVTNVCNFKCTFCSASNLSKTQQLSLDSLIEFVQQYQDDVNSIAFEGGDPLCVKPDYYHQFFKWKDANPKLKNVDVTFTSNLWDFYKHPDKWIDLFNREDVDIGTSFQYGDARRVTDSLVYTEDIFKTVFNKVVDATGKVPGFITVVDNTNQHTIEKTCLLAKSLNTVCKINPLFYSGRADSFYRWDLMLLRYADLFEQNLDQYEINCRMIRSIIDNRPDRVGCPFHSRNCNNDFRVINPDGYIKTCSIDQNLPHGGGVPITVFKRGQLFDITTNTKISLSSSKCLTCAYYHWCNNCRIKIMEFKTISDHDQYCTNIKTAIDRITKVIHG